MSKSISLNEFDMHDQGVLAPMIQMYLEEVGIFANAFSYSIEVDYTEIEDEQTKC